MQISPARPKRGRPPSASHLQRCKLASKKKAPSISIDFRRRIESCVCLVKTQTTGSSSAVLVDGRAVGLHQYTVLGSGHALPNDAVVQGAVVQLTDGDDTFEVKLDATAVRRCFTGNSGDMDYCMAPVHFEDLTKFVGKSNTSSCR